MDRQRATSRMVSGIGRHGAGPPAATVRFMRHLGRGSARRALLAPRPTLTWAPLTMDLIKKREGLQMQRGRNIGLVLVAGAVLMTGVRSAQAAPPAVTATG